MMRKASAKCVVILHAHYWRNQNQWLGECVELGTTTFADTFEDVQRELKDMIVLHLDTLESVGERDNFFKEHEIKTYSEGEVPEKISEWVPVGDGEGPLTEAFQIPVAVPA